MIMQVHASAAVAAGDPAEAAKTPSKPWPGVKVVPLLGSAAIGLALRFLVPIPSGLSTQAWTLLSIFVSTIAGASALEPERILPTCIWEKNAEQCPDKTQRCLT